MKNQGLMDGLLTRRSCRKFEEKLVSKEDLDAILKAGTFAPSGMNRQSHLFFATQDPELIARISRLNADVMGSQNDPFYGASTLVVVFADSEVLTHVEDGSLAMGNLMLAAHSLGLASCWIHRARQVFASEEGKEIMKTYGIPKKYVGIGNCIIGYPSEDGFRPLSPRKEGNIIKA